MTSIVLLLLLQAGVIPVLSQSQYDYLQQQQQQRSPLPARFSDYVDYGRKYYDGSNEESHHEGTDFGIQQPSFFGSFTGSSNSGSGSSDNVNSNDNTRESGPSSLIIEGSYGGLTPPPPLIQPSARDNSSNNNQFVASDRLSIVPSSLRELEESYIRSLSGTSSSSTKEPYLDPYGESGQPRTTPGVESYSSFMTNRRQGKNNFSNQFRPSLPVSTNQGLEQTEATQSAPITYGIPLVNQQLSASNSIDAQIRPKERGNLYTYPQRNIVPNFPDFGSPNRPPIPQEPDLPLHEDEIEEATRKPPDVILPNPQNFHSFGLSGPPIPLTSPPSIFDPRFPDPVIQHGFIPSFGPPTKEPFGLKRPHSFIHEPQHNHLTPLASPLSAPEAPTTSAVPVLRPDFGRLKNNLDNLLPDGVSSAPPESDEKREGTVYKHISVHVPAEDLDEDISAPRIVKVAKNPDKHIKVIFIKPPDPTSQKTEVQVPPAPHQKTLVYVLSESGGTRRPIKLITPAPLKPAPPQVYFLRYTDPRVRDSQAPPISTDHVISSPSGPPPTPPIKHLSSPADPDAEVLRSAPSPILPTFSSFSSPSNSLSQLALQTTLTSPTAFTTIATNFDNNNSINNHNNDPTNSKFHNGPSPVPRTTNNHLAALHAFPSPTVQPQQINSNPFPPPNYYSSLYHLYPPPVVATSVPNQSLLYFSNPIQYQQYQQQQATQHQQLAQSPYKAGKAAVPVGSTEQPSSSIQGLYTVAPLFKNLPGSINFNSLVQNPDGKNLPRSPRNFVMMPYAPTYMPSASGSDHVPVFSSPAEFIKSLLGDSYMYYNNIGNNTIHLTAPEGNHAQSSQDNIINNNNNNNNDTVDYYHHQYLQTVAISPSSTTTTTTTTPPPPVIRSSSVAPSTQAPRHHTIPLILNWENLQNLSRPPHLHPQVQNPQPFTIVIRSSHGIEENARFHQQQQVQQEQVQKQKQQLQQQQIQQLQQLQQQQAQHIQHLQQVHHQRKQPHKTYPTVAVPPPIHFNPYQEVVVPVAPQPAPPPQPPPKTTTTPAPQPRISWPPSTPQPPSHYRPSVTTTRRTQILQLPIIIYEGSKGKESYHVPPENLTTANSVTSHFNNLFHTFKNSLLQTSPSPSLSTSYNNTDYASNEHSTEYGSSSSSQSESGSDESGEIEGRQNQQFNFSSNESGEVLPFYVLGGPKGNGSIIILSQKELDNSNHRSVLGSLKQGGSRRRKNRKRVNPANVKPGRRLRKVRKPNKKNKRESDSDNSNNKNNNDNPNTGDVKEATTDSVEGQQ